MNGRYDEIQSDFLRYFKGLLNYSGFEEGVFGGFYFGESEVIFLN
jgi:hypothetical protein